MMKPSNAGAANIGLGYIAQYFDVTTTDVLQRLLWSAVPFRKEVEDPELEVPLNINAVGGPLLVDESEVDISSQGLNRRRRYSYIERFIQSRPDLYGPFWVSTTLIFTIAIFSNISSFVRHQPSDITPMAAENSTNNVGHVITPSGSVEWHYSMDELNMSASLIMFYVTLVPTLLWFLFWFQGCSKYYTLTETICAYGYSLSIFIPLSALLTIQISIFRYVIVITATLLSGIPLIMSFLPVVQSTGQGRVTAGGSHSVLILAFICHFGLAYVIHRIMLQ